MLSQKSIDRIVEEQAGMLPESIVEHLRKASPGSTCTSSNFDTTLDTTFLALARVSLADRSMSAVGTVAAQSIMLVADMMTSDARVKQIGRHGVSGSKASVLARASFEITTKHLLESSARGEVDRLEGIIENVIIGQPIPLGTGMVKLSMKEG